MTLETHPTVINGNCVLTHLPGGKNEIRIFTNTVASHFNTIVLFPLSVLLYWGTRVVTTLNFINKVPIPI